MLLSEKIPWILSHLCFYIFNNRGAGSGETKNGCAELNYPGVYTRYGDQRTSN
jgi:hypothetical protein